MAAVSPQESEQVDTARKSHRGLPLLIVLVIVLSVGLLIATQLWMSGLDMQAHPASASAEPPEPIRPSTSLPSEVRTPVTASIGRETASIIRETAPRSGAPETSSPPNVRVVSSATNDASSPTRLTNRISWNYWIDLAGGSSLAPRARLEKLGLGTTRQLVFRLSTTDLAEHFPAVKTLAGSPELLLAVRAALDDTARATLMLDVLVQSVDPQRLKLAPGADRIALEVDLARMRQRLVDPALAMHATIVPSETQLEAALIAEFRVGLMVQVSGQHELGIVIVDRATGFPLQSVIVTVDPDKSWPHNVIARGNGRVLGSGGAPYDLVLYLHDLGSSAVGEKSRSLHAQLYYRDPVSGNRELVTWRAELDLPGLVSSSATFRHTVASIASGEVLLEAARDFGRSLFEPVPADGDCAADSNCAAARRGRAVILAAANYRPEQLPPSMLIRIVSSAPAVAGTFASPVFPIGALGVALDDGDEPIFLGERFALALVLSDQQFESNNSCPQHWYIALPRTEDHPPTASNDALADALKGLAPLTGAPDYASQLYRQSSTLVQLKQWIGNSSRSEDGSYVFAYLGHHDEGRLFLDQTSAGVTAGSMRRRFGSSSIAILNACDSALADVNNGTPVGRLAQQRVESTIATTSKVSGYLAAAYLDCLTTVLHASDPLTVGQAHARATQCLWSEAQSQRWGRRYAFRGAALKYLLIGNAHQRICPPAKEKPP